jgi:hypothetical protein
MANTYTLISSVTATGGTSVSFTSIPQTYTDLVILVSAKSTYTSGGGSASFSISFNSNGSNYNSRSLQMYASSSIANNTDSDRCHSGVVVYINSQIKSSIMIYRNTYRTYNTYDQTWQTCNDITPDGGLDF